MLGNLLRRKRKPPPQESSWLDPRELKDKTLLKHAQLADTLSKPDGSFSGDMFNEPIQQAKRHCPTGARLQRQNAFYVVPTPSRARVTHKPPLTPLAWLESPPLFQKTTASWPILAMSPCRYFSILHLSMSPCRHSTIFQRPHISHASSLLCLLHACSAIT